MNFSFFSLNFKRENNPQFFFRQNFTIEITTWIFLNKYVAIKRTFEECIFIRFLSQFLTSLLLLKMAVFHQQQNDSKIPISLLSDEELVAKILYLRKQNGIMRAMIETINNEICQI